AFRHIIFYTAFGHVILTICLIFRYATSKGYWTDPYVQYFVRPVGERRLEEGLLHTMLLNLCCLLLGYYGYYACLRGMNHLDAFLRKTVCNCQIVNLGAGLDTTFWRLKKHTLMCSYNVVHHFRTKPLLSKPLIETYSTDSLLLNSDGHWIIGADQRDIPGLDDKLKKFHLNPESRIEHLEFLDEKELLQQLLQHSVSAGPPRTSSSRYLWVRLVTYTLFVSLYIWIQNIVLFLSLFMTR
uniref:[phosphatase 2A protein]-leucine-carboxy methyltransferase n=1 Tax=Oncorhynchus mykiss TaxID=8022 RepID=A0A8K9XTY9_ONCMY